MPIKDLKTDSVKFLDPKYIIITPYGDTTWGNTSYKVIDVVADSTTLESEEPTENPIECEFTDTPIYTRTSGGATTFSCQVAEFKGEFLNKFLGYQLDDEDTPTKAYKPASASKVTARIDLVYEETVNGVLKKKAIVLPKIALNSQLSVTSLKSSIALVTLSGTVESITQTVGSNQVVTDLYLDYNYTDLNAGA